MTHDHLLEHIGRKYDFLPLDILPRDILPLDILPHDILPQWNHKGINEGKMSQIYDFLPHIAHLGATIDLKNTTIDLIGTTFYLISTTFYL